MIRPSIFPPFRGACALAALTIVLTPAVRAGLVAYWPFDDADTLRRNAVNGTTLTAGGGVFTAGGKSGGGLQLNGSGQYLGGTVPDLPIGNSTYTIAAWFKPTTLGARGIVGWGNYGSGRQVNALRLFDSGNGFRHYWWGADLDATGLSTNFLNGSWHHVAATWDGSTRRLYLNGVQIASDNPGSNGSANANFRIGSTNNGEYFAGTLDDVALYNNALTLTEVQALAAGGSPFAGPVITAFTAAPGSGYEGDAVTLTWSVDTSKVTGTFSWNLLRDGTTLTSGTTASGSYSTVIPDLAGTAQDVTWTLQAVETGGTDVTVAANATVQGDPGKPQTASQAGLTTPAGTPLSLTLGGSDPNGGTLSWVIDTPPAKGTLSGSGPAFTYTPLADATGPDEFTFHVSDGKYSSAPATVRLRILTPPLPPSAVLVEDTTIRPENGPGDFLSTISSPDPNAGEAHTFTLVGGAGSEENGNFSIAGNQLRAAVAFSGLTGQPQRIRIRSTDSAGLSVEGAFVLTVVAKSRGLVINEIHYNSQNNTIRNSFVELYNDGDAAVDLTGWRLSGGADYPFPAGTTVMPGGYLVVAEDPAVMQSYFGAAALGPWENAVKTGADGSVETSGLSNDGDTVRLRDATDDIVSEVDYGNHSPWPSEPNGGGCSLERIHPGLDGSHGSNWAAAKPGGNLVTDIASPGARNLQYAATAAPAVRKVEHTPQTPASSDPVVITARITDPDGVSGVSLSYQLCTAGNYIPSTLPKTISGGAFVSVNTPLAANPAFEDPLNWTVLAMNDDGLGDDVLGGDGIWTATIPPQANRTLIRYRITATDNPGASARYPRTGDPSLNFACFVYNGVPDYEGTSAADLETLPAYHFLTRKQDYEQCVAYNASYRLNAGASWTFENWEACFVSNGVVYDHLPYRLKGANGRYTASGTGGAGNAKRAFKFLFHKGYEFDARHEDGTRYPVKWSTMITENCWENRATYTFSLNEAVNFEVLNRLGVPSPRGNWAHFRTILQPDEQPDKWHGDFWGMMWVHEDYDRRFLKAHDLKKGNLYKLTRDGTSGSLQFRYQAAFAPANYSDHDQLFSSLRGTSTPAYITARVNLPLWSRYHAFCEAIRHYDYWPSGDNNAGWYFYPDYQTANGNKGVLWYLPNDLDATWGPTWNNGHDLVHNALFNDSASTGGDSATNPTLWPVYFNQVREIRALLWQPDQINPLIDEFAAVIRPFVNADFTRWYNAPADAGNFNGLSGTSAVGQTSLASYVAGMKDFAFDDNRNGSTWPGGNVGVGGRAAWLDSLGNSIGENATKYPATPVLTYAGAAGYPVNDLRFSVSDFSDPQGAGTFAAQQWRVAEVNPSADFVPGEKRLLEINATYETGEHATFAPSYQFPSAACVPGKRYRARVRMKDGTGRWSYWSAPVEFTAGTVDVTPLADALVVSEIMYHSTDPTPAEQAAAAALVPAQVWTDDSFDWLELRNVSAGPVDLSGLAFTTGFDFVFPEGTVLAAGASGLLVQNAAAFTTRYGAGLPVLGEWDPNDKLSNGGDFLTLVFGLVTPPVSAFAYDDNPATGWPVLPDGGGASLVRIAPEDTSRDPGLAVNWRSSLTPGGSPGTDDRQSYAQWKTALGVTSEDDTDGDGLPALAEYALGGNPAAPSASALPVGARVPLTIGAAAPADYFTLTFPRANAAEDVTQRVEFSTDLTDWPLTGVLVSSTDNGDGTRTEVWRTPAPVSPEARLFGRLRFTRP